MPMFEIEQYELHTMTYRVEADSQAEAIQKLLDGACAPVEASLEYIEVAEGLGLPVEQHQQLADELRVLGVTVDDDVIPSVRKIEEVESV